MLYLLGIAAVPAVPPTDTIQFVFVKIPEDIMPIARGKKYEDPLDSFLQMENVGRVTGAGTQLSHPDKDGNREIEWVGVDVDLTDFDRGQTVQNA